MWSYSVGTGWLIDPEGQLLGIGYSGFGDGKNDAGLCSVHDIGPIPLGSWVMGARYDSATHGPCVIPLSPSPLTNVYGRDGFLVHGDSILHEGMASHGCIVIQRSSREELAASPDRILEVIA